MALGFAQDRPELPFYALFMALAAALVVAINRHFGTAAATLTKNLVRRNELDLVVIVLPFLRPLRVLRSARGFAPLEQRAPGRSGAQNWTSGPPKNVSKTKLTKKKPKNRKFRTRTK